MSAFGVHSEVVPPRSDAVSAFPTYGNSYFHRRSVNTDYRKRARTVPAFAVVFPCAPYVATSV